MLSGAEQSVLEPKSEIFLCEFLDSERRDLRNTSKIHYNDYTFANQHSQNDIRDRRIERFILYPPLSKVSNWTITLLVEPFKEQGKR